MRGGLGPAYAGNALLDRARAFLAAGPADSVSLIGHVCALPSPPRAVAEHMAHALFLTDAAFRQLPDGTWQLLDQAVSPAVVREGRTDVGEPLRAMTWVVVDVETTGTRSWGGDRIMEVAVVRVQGGRIVDVMETLVNPERAVPASVSRLTNISTGMVARAPLFEDVCERVCAALEGAVFVAHNVAFDWRFLTQEIQRASGRRLAARRLCTVRLARAVLPQLPRRSLDALSAYFGVENHARHRAGGDAVATAKILPRLLELAGERDCLTWGDLQKLLRRAPQRRRKRRRMPTSIDVDPTV